MCICTPTPGKEFIPLGAPGAFDSHTTYTSWSGTAAPLLDPHDADRTLFYYSGGDVRARSRRCRCVFRK